MATSSLLKLVSSGFCVAILALEVGCAGSSGSAGTTGSTGATGGGGTTGGTGGGCGPVCPSCTIPYSTHLYSVAELACVADGGCPPHNDAGTYVGDCPSLCAEASACAIDCCDFEPLSDGGSGVACHFVGPCS